MPLQANKSIGYKTGARVLIFSMFGFYLLRYPAVLSVGLGAIAGLTSGFIAAWWHAQEDYMTDAPKTAPTAEPNDKALVPSTSQPRPVRYGFGVKTTRAIRATRPGISGFGWPFRRKR